MADYLTWALNALKLPAKIIAGLFLFSLLVLVFDYFALVNLSELHPLARPIVIIGALAFGSLSFAAVCGVVYDNLMQRRKTTLLSHRRELRRAEAKQDQAEYQAQVLKRLDYLSKDEIRYVANCLHRNEQSFLTYAHSGAVSNLIARGLVGSPGGSHHQDYYPYYFADFVWQALLARKDEFIGKDNEHKRREAEEKERAMKRRY
jgi:hypothetical protein